MNYYNCVRYVVMNFTWFYKWFVTPDTIRELIIIWTFSTNTLRLKAIYLTVQSFFFLSFPWSLFLRLFLSTDLDSSYLYTTHNLVFRLISCPKSKVRLVTLATYTFRNLHIIFDLTSTTGPLSTYFAPVKSVIDIIIRSHHDWR